MSILDPEAARTASTGDPARRSGPDDGCRPRLAVEHPVPIELPPSRLRGDAPLAKLLRRAMDSRRAVAARPSGRADLIEALVEAEAERPVSISLDSVSCASVSSGRTPRRARHSARSAMVSRRRARGADVSTLERVAEHLTALGLRYRTTDDGMILIDFAGDNALYQAAIESRGRWSG